MTRVFTATVSLALCSLLAVGACQGEPANTAPNVQTGAAKYERHCRLVMGRMTKTAYELRQDKDPGLRTIAERVAVAMNLDACRAQGEARRAHCVDDPEYERCQSDALEAAATTIAKSLGTTSSKLWKEQAQLATDECTRAWARVAGVRDELKAAAKPQLQRSAAARFAATEFTVCVPTTFDQVRIDDCLKRDDFACLAEIAAKVDQELEEHARPRNND